MTTDDLLTNVRAWCRLTRDVNVSLGPTEREFIERAVTLAERLEQEPVQKLAKELQADSEAPELVHALRQVLESAGDSEDEGQFNRVCSAYELASLLSWQDEIDEGAEIRSQLALIAWRHCRRFRTYQEARTWESRIVEHALQQSHVCDFLSLAGADRSDDLTCRYLVDSAVALALTKKLEEERNRDFSWVAVEATAAFELMQRLQVPRDPEERAYLLVNIALSAMAAFRHRGLLRSVRDWIKLARRNLKVVVGGRPLKAIIDFAELTLWFDSLNFTPLRARFASIREELVECGLDRYVACADLVSGDELKASGRLEEALSAFQRTAEWCAMSGDRLLGGLALISAAEVASKLSPDIDFAGFRHAQVVLEQQEVRWPIGQLQAVIGECLRDRGRLGEAIEAYRSSVRLYRDLQMKSRVAYIQLLLAEALIAAGRDVEAAAEIGEAVEISKDEGMVAVVAAGVALLKESLQRVESNQDRNNAKGRLQAIRQLFAR